MSTEEAEVSHESRQGRDTVLGYHDKVLLVEDFEDTVRIIRRLLERNGFDVETALSISEAKDRLQSMVPDVIILDINLTDGSGLDLLQDIREIHIDIPVIMLTAYTELENAIRSLQQGVEDFIPKPFDNNYLVHAVAKAVEKRKLRERLKQSEKFRLLGELAAGVAHDFANLLHSMATHVYLLKKKGSDPLKNLEHLSAIETAIEDASVIVRRLNAMGKPSEAELRVLELSSLIRDTMLMTKPKWYHEPRKNGRQIDIESDLEADIYVNVNPSEIREVFTNLIFNAVDAMPSGGVIHVSTEKDGDRAVCTLQDSGIGMTPELIERIFDPFFTTKGHGSGLGLSISYAIIQKHHGEMHVRSVPGKGTKFIISIPCIDTFKGQ